MTDLDDLIARLRMTVSPLGKEAAAALEAMRDEVARKDAAIKRALDEAVADDFDEWFAGLRASLTDQ